MKISPRMFASLDDFAYAVQEEKTRRLPKPTVYDDWVTADAMRDAIRVAECAAMEKAREKWELHLDHMEDMYERGVGPSWQ